MNRRFFAWALGLCAAGVGLAGGAAGVLGLPLVDIRPQSVSVDADPGAEARGRALLLSAFEAHGGQAALSRHRTEHLSLHDEWFGAAKWFNPWPSADQHLSMTANIHTFDSYAALLDGPEAGVTWGITEGRTWRETPAGRVFEPDADIAFMLPTVHYFLEMPQRLTEAALVRYVGDESIGGRDYHVVYATWGSITANREFDQYLVYIDAETGRLGKVAYTVREVASVASGVAHLDDQREIDGWWVAHDMWVTPTVSDSAADALHRMVVSDFRFDDPQR